MLFLIAAKLLHLRDATSCAPNPESEDWAFIHIWKMDVFHALEFTQADLEMALDITLKCSDTIFC